MTQLIAADAFDDLSASVTSVNLADHLASVAAIAEAIGRSAGLPADLVEAVTAAAAFHDLGKADPRFQRWLDPNGLSDALVAKSDAPRWTWESNRASSGWPKGGRHEALSSRLIERWLETNPDPGWDQDLVLHLAISHHGFGRPLVASVKDLTPVDFATLVAGQPVTIQADLSEVDWDQPARFRTCCERYGYWGLALLEAIVRQADHIASSLVLEEDVGVA